MMRQNKIGLTYAVVTLSTMMTLTACNPQKFDSPLTAAIAPSVESEGDGDNRHPPTEGVSTVTSKLSDLVLRTEMNVPIDFIAEVVSPEGAPGDGEISFDEKKPELKSIETRFGRFEVIDAKTFKLRYIPRPDFRGEDTIKIFLFEDSRRHRVSAIVRIQVDNPLVTLKPALAVRATGCIMCHAQVSSNIVTDFGYGDPYFFGGSVLQPVDKTSIYADESTDPAWKYISRLGEKVYVPKASTATLTKIGTATLAAYITNVLAANPASAVKTSQVTEVDSMYIGAPSASRILKAAHLPPGSEKLKFIPDFKQPHASGLVRKTGPGGSEYYSNDGTNPISCSGDLVVDGIVYLDQARIQSNTGCRIYATRSIFVRGPITFDGGDEARRNLQLVSARSINLGLGKNTCNAKHIGTDSFDQRLKKEVRRQYFFTRGEPEKTVQQKLDDILADSQTIGTLIDAACDGPAARNVAFERIILNAPIVFSRYTGGFKGSIIAEIALMSLNQFVFEFDPIFSKEVVLPLLSPSDYLLVK